jgi:HAD superfamily hydrolase (TIGR01484 family)
MKFSVLALDYDGTIAEQGRPDPAVMAALRAARAKGIVIVLVTGRILEDLRKVAGDLSVFEAIVAENDQPLATEIRTVEREYRHEGLDDPVPSLIRSIHARYELEET